MTNKTKTKFVVVLSNLGIWSKIQKVTFKDGKWQGKYLFSWTDKEGPVNGYMVFDTLGEARLFWQGADTFRQMVGDLTGLYTPNQDIA
jgi:hypothetical protein